MSKQAKEGVTTIRSRLATGIPFAVFFNGSIAGLIAILLTQDGLYHTIANIILAGVLTGVVTISVIIDNIRDLKFNDCALFFVMTIAVLMLVCPPIVIIAIVQNLTSAIAGATFGYYGRAVTVGIISGAAVTIFDKRSRVASTLLRVAVNYTNILLIASVLFQVIFGIYNFVSILAATAGAYVGAAVYARITGRVLRASNQEISNMVTVDSTVTAFGAFIGASIGALTVIAIISGAIIGGIVGAFLLSEADIVSAVFNLVETFIPTEPYSISIRLIALPIRAALRILGPAANMINEIITPKRPAVIGVFGVVIGAVIGAYAGVIGGACTGVMIAGYTAGKFSIISIYYRKNLENQSDSETDKTSAPGGDIKSDIITKIKSCFSAVCRQVGIILKSINEADDIAVPLILPGIINTMILSTVCAWASRYFITSALIGTFGPYISYFIENVIALSEAITGNVNIASSGVTGGLIGTIIVGIYYTDTEAANDEFEVYALGAIGAITGFITARVDEAIGNALLTNVGIPIGGAALGAFSGLLGGALMVIAKVPMESVTKVGGLVVTITAMTGGFIGGIIGGYFSFSATFTGLFGIAFSVTSTVILIAVTIIRQRRYLHITE
jgi:hypothetical protein